MKIFTLLCLFLLIAPCHFAQEKQIDFCSEKNIKKFADYLFCDKDYLRAANEYERLTAYARNDTIIFKTGLAYLFINDYRSSIDNFAKIPYSSSFYINSNLEQMKVHFLMNDYSGLREFYKKNFFDEDYSSGFGKKLFNFSYLRNNMELPEKEKFLYPFASSDKDKLTSFYDWKKDPPYKSPAIAGILSALVPGSGKIYTGDISDGVISFLVTGIFAFLAYDNFRANHDTRAWIFSGLTAFFYSGNVYGSIAAAQIYNAKITFEFNDSLNVFIQNKNYFVPEYDFCR
jgi:hypothetical protein